ATFTSANRLGYPPARTLREKLLARLDALLALSESVRDAAEERFPGDYRVVSPGVDTTAHPPGAKGRTIVAGLRPNERIVARGVLLALRELPEWRVVLLRTRPLIGRPTIPRELAGRVEMRTARGGAARAPILAAASIFVPGIDGLPRVALEAGAAGC